MSDTTDGISRRHALRLALGQGGQVARERDQLALELDQEAALEGARPGRFTSGFDPEGEERPGAPPEGHHQIPPDR